MPIPRDARPLRIARWAEAAYALSALVVTAALPSPSTANATEWVHWFGTAILAALIAFRLARPNHAVWWVAAVLAAYVIGVSIVSGLRSGGLAVPRAPVALALFVVLIGSQVVVAACLTRLRHLGRTRS